MSLDSTLQSIGNDIEAFWQRAKADAQKARALWSIISSPQTRAIMTRVTRDVIHVVKDVTGAVEAGGIDFNLDVAVVADVRMLIADAKRDGVIASDLKAIGVVLGI